MTLLINEDVIKHITVIRLFRTQNRFYNPFSIKEETIIFRIV
jgi:hypothetical protein